MTPASLRAILLQINSKKGDDRVFSWKRIRYGIMFGFLAYITWVGYQHQLLGGGRGGIPTVDALCPFGGLEAVYAWLTSGEWLRRTAPSSLVLFVIVAVLTLLLGRVFCGSICPLGSIGEFSNLAARKLGIRRRELPPSLDRGMRLLKYLFLFVILYMTWTTGTLAWRDRADPWSAWMHLSSGWEEISASPGGFIVLFILVIGAGLLIERFWCRYLCPLGAALGILQKFSLTKVAREEDTCISCGKCNRSCPMGLDPMSVDRVTSADCISCGRCVEECPVPGTLRFSTVGGWAMSALSVGLLGVTLYFAGYGASRLTGYWQTFPPTPTVSTSTAASPTGVPRNPDELKGSFSLAEIASGYGLELSSILEKAGWPADTDPDIKMREAADALGREASDIRNAVKELLKGP